MKPREIKIDNKKYFAWPYEEQTQIKHKVLGAYYKVFASKLGVHSNTLFIDCHGGCGAYIKDTGEISYGSAILVSQTAAPLFLSRTTNNYCIVSELDKTNYDNLIEVINDCKSDKITPINADYNDILFDSKIVRNYTLCSTLFFIDPFGYYDTPMNNMSGLMKSFGNEILINFMFDFLNRGIGVSTIDESQLTAFFGDERWKDAKSLSGIDRESFLVNLYKSNLKKVTGAKYVFAYRLCYPNKNQTYYYLIHATNHIDGITLMKECFASISNGRVEYLGKKNDELSLFDMDFFKNDELTSLLMSKYAGQTLAFEDIWCNIVEETASLEKDLRSAIKDMEQNGNARIIRIESKRTGLKGKDQITIG